MQATVPKLDPVPGAPGGPRVAEPPLFETPPIPLPPVSTRKLKIGNRSANPTFAKYMTMPNGEQIALVTGGIKLLATFPERGNEILDVEADELVVWQTGGKTSELVEAMRDNEGVTQGNDRHIELFMTGNVIIRYGAANDPRLPDGSLIEEKVMRGIESITTSAAIRRSRWMPTSNCFATGWSRALSQPTDRTVIAAGVSCDGRGCERQQAARRSRVEPAHSQDHAH